MNRISPVWILTSLTGEAFDKFKKAIDQQFKAFSETELNGFQDCVTHQWWGVETTDFGLANKWSPQTGYPNGIPAYQPNIFPLFDGNQGIVIYYSPLQDFTAESRYIEDLKNNPLFFNTYGGNKFFYGLTSFHKEETAKIDFQELVQAIETNETQNRLFSSVTFMSDSSHVAGVNPNGYLHLNEDDYLALIVNTIFTIAITKRELHQLNNVQGRLFNTAGVFSFTYEPDALKKEKAYNLSEQLLNAFCNNNQDPEWYSQNDAKIHFESSSLQKDLHWYNIYKLLSQGFEEESLKGLYSKCEVSPWRMFAFKLVPLYFKKHLKPLLRKLYDNVHDFSLLTIMRYESFARNKRLQMLDGTAEIEDRQQFAMNAIAGYLSSVWSPNYRGAKGVQQVLLLVKKVKDFLDTQKTEISRVKAYKAPNDVDHKSFPTLHEYPLIEITKEENEYYYKHYKELVTDGEPPAENTGDADMSYEERQLSTLRKLLEWHPMPLNLFTKAGLLSVLAFVAIWAITSIIQSTNLIHIFSLGTDQSLITLFCTITVLILIFGFVKYGLKTLRKIRLAIEKYIAWSYYRVQREVYSISLGEAEKYYDELIKECDRIDTQLRAFVESEVKNKPIFEKYRISKFQRNILDNMDDGSQILENAALNVFLNINNNVYSPDEVTHGLFDDMLKVGSNQDLDEKMRECMLMESSNGEKKAMKEELLRIWSETLVDNIQITIYGQQGNSVDFPAFYNTPTSNFTIAAWLSANAIIHPSVYVYAMNPYSCAASLVPNGNGHANGDRWENMFFGPNPVNQEVPNYAQNLNQPAWFTTTRIAIFLRIHAYNRLIVKDNNNMETTIFNNQLT